MNATARLDLLSFNASYQAPKKLVRLTVPLELFNSRMTRQKCLEDKILKKKSHLGIKTKKKSNSGFKNVNKVEWHNLLK